MDKRKAYSQWNVARGCTALAPKHGTPCDKREAAFWRNVVASLITQRSFKLAGGGGGDTSAGRSTGRS